MIASGGPRPARGTLVDLFFTAIDRYHHTASYQVKRAGKYQPINAAEVQDRVRSFSMGLRALGLNPGDRVAILSENRPEWAYADWACLTARLADVPVYPTLPAEQIIHILVNSGAKAIFVSNETQAAKIAKIRADVPDLKHVIVFTPELVPGADLTLAALEAHGHTVAGPAAIAACSAAISSGVSVF